MCLIRCPSDPVRGRHQYAATRDNGGGRIVDYAHTLAIATGTSGDLRPACDGALGAIVGAGGDRDRASVGDGTRPAAPFRYCVLWTMTIALRRSQHPSCRDAGLPTPPKSATGRSDFLRWHRRDAQRRAADRRAKGHEKPGTNHRGRLCSPLMMWNKQ